MKRLLAIVVLLIAGLGGGVIAWALYFRPLAVHVSAMQRDVAVQVFGLGTVEARVTSKVGFKVAGVLIDLRADVGELAPKGAILARLDDREQRARAARAKAAKEQAEANAQRAAANVERANANYANARSINERRQSLLLSNAASAEAAQTARAAQEAALADVHVANSDVLVAKAAIGDATAQEQQEAATLDFHTLAAPYDAMIITRQKERGSALAAGEAVYTLVDPKSVWVLAYVDESKAGEIRIGNTAEIVLRSLPSQRFQGRVARIDPEGDRVNEERRIQVAFDQIPDDFHLGEQAEVSITTMRLDRAFLVPAVAVEALGGSRGTVWTVEGGLVGRREVTLGHRLLDGRYEIVSGIPENAAVVIEMLSGLRTGRAVRIIEGADQ